ncbi:MAG: NUDIX domain-containing protein [Deinococcota bacterium]
MADAATSNTTASTSPLYVVAVAAIIVRADKVLAMRRSQHKDASAGLWETLSGRVDAGEEPFETIKREIIEECGLVTNVDPRPVTSYSAMRADKPMIVIVYQADYVSGEVVRSDEHDDHAWVTPDEFVARSSLSKLAKAIYSVFEDII